MTKKIIILISLTTFLTSLTTTDKDLIGKYLTKGSRMRYYIKLKSDHSFIQEMKSCISDSRSKGTWSTNGDTLNLSVKTFKDLRDNSPEKEVNYTNKYLITTKGLSVMWRTEENDSIRIGTTIRRVN